MKRMILVWMALFAFCVGARADDETDYRVFTSKDGRAIEARILEYDANRGRLKIERRGGKIIKIAPDVFGESDQAYIKRWIEASMFLMESNLRVTIKKTNEGRSGSKKKDKEETEKISYEVKVQNRSKKTLNISKVEYRYYIRNEGTRGKQDTERSERGELDIGALVPSKTKIIKTPSLSLVTKYSTRTESSYDAFGNWTYDTIIEKASEDRLRGIWIRFYGPKIDGKPLYRDVTYPKGLDETVAWDATSKES